MQNPYSKGVWQNGRRCAELVTAVFCRRQTKIGTRLGSIKATKKVSWCKTRTQKGRGKMAAKGQSWSQQFECLNVLGFQRPLARMCGLSIRPDIFCCLPVLKTGVAKWPPKCRKFVTVFCVPKCARISTTFGTHLWTGDMS